MELSPSEPSLRDPAPFEVDTELSYPGTPRIDQDRPDTLAPAAEFGTVAASIIYADESEVFVAPDPVDATTDPEPVPLGRVDVESGTTAQAPSLQQPVRSPAGTVITPIAAQPRAQSPPVVGTHMPEHAAEIAVVLDGPVDNGVAREPTTADPKQSEQLTPQLGALAAAEIPSDTQPPAPDEVPADQRGVNYAAMTVARGTGTAGEDLEDREDETVANNTDEGGGDKGGKDGGNGGEEDDSSGDGEGEKKIETPHISWVEKLSEGNMLAHLEEAYGPSFTDSLVPEGTQLLTVPEDAEDEEGTLTLIAAARLRETETVDAMARTLYELEKTLGDVVLGVRLALGEFQANVLENIFDAVDEHGESMDDGSDRVVAAWFLDNEGLMITQATIGEVSARAFNRVAAELNPNYDVQHRLTHGRARTSNGETQDDKLAKITADHTGDSVEMTGRGYPLIVATSKERTITTLPSAFIKGGMTVIAAVYDPNFVFV